MSSQPINNEAALVCAGRNGDKEALRLLLMNNWSWLKAIVYNITGNIDETDDVLQNICLRVIANIKHLRKPSSFRPWLAVLAKREALTIRKKNKKPFSLQRHTTEVNHDQIQENPLEKMVQNERYGQVLGAIETLPQKYREVMLLKYINDITYSKIAEILEVPITTVQIRLVRGRRMVYERIADKPAQKVQRT
jgi:RNA polymerase sigma-70 factor (ECF subfamily)